MSIYINEESKEFHLQTRETSYIFTVLKNGELGQLYYGKKIKHRSSFSHLLQLPNEPLGNATFVDKGDNFFSLEAVKQEYPSYGTTDFREPAFHLLQADGSRVSNFKFESYNISRGKPKLKGLPATYVEHDDAAETVTIVLKDMKLNATIHLVYTVFQNENVITRNATLENKGEETIKIERFLSAVVDLPSSNYELLQLDGAWIRERHVTERPLSKGVQYIDSKRGVSSSQHNPFLALKGRHTTEHSGEVYGFSLVYSGNFLAGVEVDHYDTSRVFIGINPFDFSWNLEPAETFQAPEVVMVYSTNGLNEMSQTFHQLFKQKLVRGKWRDEPRPILINNWEATYFDFNEEKLLQIADASKELGIELFVLDDGWFQGRNNDTTSLGDWVVDKNKIPSGLAALSKKINENGMQFGLWVEPEMISEKSHLFEAHPDWVLKVTDRPHSHGRNQYILDLTRRDVRDYLLSSLKELFGSANISYVKWDMNRNMTEIGSAKLPATRQGEVAHRYILGLYEILEELTNSFPEILFESCASGGNRFDPGMLYYMPQTWASDNTDAIERLKIQYGTSIVYPLSTIGAHVSSCPNHQTGRNVPIETRFHASMFGAFGYELDATKLTEEEKEVIKEQVEFIKRNREEIFSGRFYRLINPFETNDTAWMIVSENKKKAFFTFFRTLAKPNPGYERVLLQGLDPSIEYRVKGYSETFFGDELMNTGLLLPAFFNGTVKNEHSNFVGDFQSILFELEANV